MNFLKRLSGLLLGPAANNARFYPLEVRCSRCGEVISAQVNLSNDLSVEYDDKGRATYHGRKVLIGAGRCFQQIEVTVMFDANRSLLERQISGGTFLDEKKS